MSALDKQEDGNHYKDYVIQPVTFIHGNKLGFLEGCVIKRLCRWQRKDGIRDLRKAIHEIELLIELTELAEKREAMRQGDEITQGLVPMDPSYPELPLGCQDTAAEATVYDRGNPVHYRLSPGLKLPTDLPDGTVVEGPTSAMTWERIGIVYKGMLVLDRGGG